jgi:DNA-directed RNA polymerase specialized sigma24 family protein
VLVLRYFDDLTEADTAAALGISVGTVKSHVSGYDGKPIAPARW